MAHVLRERHALGVAHGLGQQAVRLLAALVRPEVVDVLEVHRVDPLEGDELVDVDRRARGRLDRTQLGVGEAHPPVVRELIALDQLAALDDALAVRAIELLADARATVLVQQVERRLLRACRDVEPDRDGDEAEADRPRPDGTGCHADLLA